MSSNSNREMSGISQGKQVIDEKEIGDERLIECFKGVQGRVTRVRVRLELAELLEILHSLLAPVMPVAQDRRRSLMLGMIIRKVEVRDMHP
jgi:hypothetical protein